jgi:hypothetical protein
MTQELQGMMVSVYSSDYPGASNYGISYTHKRLLLVGEGIPKIHEAGSCPIIELRCHQLYSGEEYLFSAPYLCHRSMAGGSFIWSTDSRFRQHISERPIPLHDRFENSCFLSDRYFELVHQYSDSGAFSYHQKDDLKASAVKSLSYIIQLIEFNQSYSSEEKALGILISHWAEWDISRLQEVARAAFIDANEPKLAKAIASLFDFANS